MLENETQIVVYFNGFGFFRHLSPPLVSLLGLLVERGLKAKGARHRARKAKGARQTAKGLLITVGL
jgi:hypothetical protein